MAITTEHEDFHENFVAFQRNKISCMCQADASCYAHISTLYSNNSECTLCMYSVMSLNILPHLNLNTVR